MPKYLYLLRHAESVQKQIGDDDRDRELTVNGIKESMLIATFLQKNNSTFDLIVSSTARRARSTTEIVSDGIKTNPEKIFYEDALYEASVRTFFDFVSAIEDQHQTVLCVGHNPTITYLTEYLTSAEIGDMPPAGMSIIKFDGASWRKLTKGGAELQRYVYPSMLLS